MIARLPTAGVFHLFDYSVRDLFRASLLHVRAVGQPGSHSFDGKHQPVANVSVGNFVKVIAQMVRGDR